jgi:hypothetical protein
MSTQLYARNLPAEASEEDIRKALRYHGKILKVEFVADARKDTDRKVAMITLDVSRYEAEQIAEKFNGRIVAGEPITLYAALHE